MLKASKPSILLVILILFGASDISSGFLNTNIYQRVLNKLLAKNLKNHFQPSTTTTEKPPGTEAMTFDKLVLNKLLAKNLKNHFQPSTTTTEKPPSTETMTFYKSVLNKLLEKNLKNHFQPSTTTTEKPTGTEKMTIDKFPASNSNFHHSQKDCLQKCTSRKWIFSLCRCLIHK